ncbi:hypothetical protein AJ81_04235 [Pseudothermotoga hypogea DSM 11164 = NBRC 106472]|uniref:Cell shape-determining protein MreC n=2 Tax=Pseudothermotoga hypogea TaxID=57487 RepID=A0A0X1KTW7_9THEM|nr:hypothetical protein [Pseudothermotoga hypogea]AJC74709.1 hypothetical protein AJ81_04235 [Pseudothermotoga hypogea DSM 11164 = NBRC 106472]MBC7122011.1 hypothetical protein [Pseudothermotoga sp.]
MSNRQVNLFIAYMLIFTTIFALNAVFQAKPARFLFRFVHIAVYPANALRYTLHKLKEAIVLVFNVAEQQTVVKINDVTFEQSNTVLGLRQNYLIATGRAKAGDIAIDAMNNRFVGIVRYVSDHVCWIEPWDSALFSMQVSVESSQVTIEGEISGGTRLKIYEDVDVTGFTVRVSENFTNGKLLREMNCDKLGTVVGRQGDFFLVKIDPVRPTRLCYLPGY